jgi:hypothetical protein
MHNVTRMASGGVIALTLALIVAAPVAAARPTRTVYGMGTGFTIPADKACPFAVDGVPSKGFSAYTEFSDGRLMGSVHLKGAYVNDETDAQYPTMDNFHFSQRTDPITGITTGTLEGQAAWWFLPGDVGLDGSIVGEHGAMYDFVGRVTFTIQANGATTQFTWKGTATDICAALS